MLYGEPTIWRGDKERLCNAAEFPHEPRLLMTLADMFHDRIAKGDIEF